MQILVRSILSTVEPELETNQSVEFLEVEIPLPHFFSACDCVPDSLYRSIQSLFHHHGTIVHALSEISFFPIRSSTGMPSTSPPDARAAGIRPELHLSDHSCVTIMKLTCNHPRKSDARRAVVSEDGGDPHRRTGGIVRSEGTDDRIPGGRRVHNRSVMASPMGRESIRD
jgi:hypothetical protein